jgi:hypothetical protein
MTLYDDDDVEFDEDRDNSNHQTSSTRDIPETMHVQNNYFENNSSGNGENVYSHGYGGDIDVSGSVFEDIDCETNTVNEFVLQQVLSRTTSQVFALRKTHFMFLQMLEMMIILVQKQSHS